MDRLRDQFLAGARLAGDQDRSFRRRYALNQTNCFVHRLRLADDFRQSGLPLELCPQPDVVDTQIAFFRRLPHPHIKLADAVGFGQVIIGAVLHCLDGSFDRALTSEHDYFWWVGPFVDSAQKFHAIHARHVDVAQQHVDIAFFQLPQRCLAIRRGLHAITQALQFFLQYQSQVGFVFCYQ